MADAVPGADGYLSIAADDPAMPVWSSLLQSGHLSEVAIGHASDRGFKLTEMAMKQLECAEIMDSSAPVFSIRDTVPLEDRTLWEFAVMLEHAGFVWRASTGTVEQRRALSYVAGGDKVWYSAGVTVPRRHIFMICSSSMLCDVMECILVM